MRIIPHTNIETLADEFLKAVVAKENFDVGTKGSFLTGGKVLVCESKGLQEYLQKKCVDERGIWTSLPFKPLAGLLMQYAYNLSDEKKDEKTCVYNPDNLKWAIYNLLEGGKKTFSFAGELATLFYGYQIYRPDLIKAWDSGKPCKTENEHEKWQREIWVSLRKKYKNQMDISQLYSIIEEKKCEIEKKQIFVFAPLSMAPVHLKSLNILAEAGCEVHLFLHLISGKYIGDAKSDKSIMRLRKKAWEDWTEKKMGDEDTLYWDIGNRLIANLGRSAQVFYEQIGWEKLEPISGPESADSLLSKIQADIINDDNATLNSQFSTLNLAFNSCFSSLREIEVLCDYILDLFIKEKIAAADIAVVSPNIETYASAIEMVFGRYKIPYDIADRDVKKSDKTVQLLLMLFSQVHGNYDASDIVALFEYSMFVQGKELNSNNRELLEKWVRENAIRHNLESTEEKPNYSFKSGFDQLAAGFFMIPEHGFSEIGEYCYTDIEGSSAKILGDFTDFIDALEMLEKGSSDKSIEDWDSFLKDCLQPFFGSDETDFTEDDNPYQEVINAWDLLKQEMIEGFGDANAIVEFSVLKNALPEKVVSSAKSRYHLNGKISFSNIDTVRAVPHKVICCIGMNSKDFPRQSKSKEISIIDTDPKPGDKDIANEDRLMFLETIRSAKEKFYISWVGQSEKNAEDLDPSSVVVMFLKNLEEQYGVNIKKIIAKHPLQPFSVRYFNNEELSTYDNRWHNKEIKEKKNIWQWQVKTEKTEEKRDVDVLYRILSDAPKYFLRTVCNIDLPEDIDLLENIEPFALGNKLEEWKLGDLILNNGNYEHEIEILKYRGSFPSGKLADKIKEQKIAQIKKMENEQTPNVKTFIKPSKDKGKYRLWHWLKHLEHNVTEPAVTEIILWDKKPLKFRLPKVDSAFAQTEIDKLWDLATGLKKQLLPIFPDAAWEYRKNKKMDNAEGMLFENEFNSQYTKMAIGNAKNFKTLGIEKEFQDCSNALFEHYNGEEVKCKN